jgi:hypothetical protein
MTIALHRNSRSAAGLDRRIAVAFVASLLLHTPLLLWLGARQVARDRGTPTSALQVRIEPQKGEQPQADTAAVMQSVPEIGDAAAPAAESRPLMPPSSAPTTNRERVADAPSWQDVSGTVAPDDAPALHATVADIAAQTIASRELILPRPELAYERAPTTDSVIATVAPAQEAVLTRRVSREARALLESGAAQRSVTFEEGDRGFTAVLTRQPAANAMGLERLSIEIATANGGERLHTRLQMKRLAFSHFTQLVDRWDPEVQLHDDEIAGRFHSNSDLHLTYDRKTAPRLLGAVTTARGVRFADQKGWRPRGEIFLGGLETFTARISLPRIALPVAHDAERVHVIDADALLVFSADGTYRCIDLESRLETRRRLAPELPTYIVGARKAALYVRGVVAGRVTLYSPRRIVVQGNLTYADDPRQGASNHYLGLVSDRTVEVDRAAVTGPGDLEIYAAIYARRRFIVRDTQARAHATLLVYGSLTAGSISATEPRYATHSQFDPRFEHVRPPGFPQTDRYEIEWWDRQWRAMAYE